MHDVIDDLWIPRSVSQELIDAARVVQWTTGPVGPRGFGTGLPRELLASMGHDPADPDLPWWEHQAPEGARSPRRITPVMMTRMEAAIRWPLTYLADGHDGPCRILALFLRCKVYRIDFKQGAARKSWNYKTCLRGRDRALGLIAQGLNHDGVEVWRR